MNLAVIPARGGSKRIPRKNIRSFCGKPMIAWAIEAARDSQLFERIIVSTDDNEIAAIALAFGAEVPFRRPASLAGDHAGTLPVIAHAIEWFSNHHWAPEYVCCIYATAPFMTALDLKDAHDKLIEECCDYVFPVTNFDFPIQRALRISANGRAEMFSPEHFTTRSQDFEVAFHDAGQFYWGRIEAWIQQRPIFSQASAPLNLPRYRVQDIDSLEDWARAEVMFEVLRRRQWM